MIVYFKQYDTGKYYASTSVSGASVGDTFLPNTVCNDLSRHLKELFEDIIIEKIFLSDYWRRLNVSLNDQADIDHFTLLTSDGIDYDFR